jgi:hypothetical protein
MATPIITLGDAEYLIVRDKIWSRFQRFCVEVMSAVERVQYVTSALSSDLGRDGRTPLVSTGSLEAVVATSVKLTPKAAVAKAKADLDRLVETGLPDRASFCFTCELEERHKQEIVRYAKQVAPSCRVRAEGVEFLAGAALRHPECFELYYRGELLALRHGLLADAVALTPTSNGLRIAMATQFGEDAGALRIAAMTNLIRLTLRGKAGASRPQLHDFVSSELGLAQRVNAAYLDTALGELQKSGEIQFRAGAVELTPAGREAATSIINDARNRLLDGRQAFQHELSRGLVAPLGSAVFDDLWVRLQDSLADLFLHEGMAVVRAILQPMPAPALAGPVDGQLWGRLAMSIVPPQIPPKEGITIGHAVLSVLTGETQTRAWLTQVAATFVSICALGLHPEAQEELLGRMRHWSLIVDNHVVISFLCAGENDHDGVLRVIESWRKLGREVATCTAVLEEAAYHAFIADRIYDENWRQMSSLSPDAAAEVLRNAFVRSFHRLSTGGYEPARWRAYILNFRGSDQFDGSNLTVELAAAGWKIIDDTKLPSHVVDELRKEIGRGSEKRVRLTRSGELEQMRRDEWDARIAFAAVHRLRKQAETSGSVIVVTKSRAIRAAAGWLASRSLGKLPIMSVSALGYAMALTPGLSLSLVHIRELLFDRNRLGRAFGRLEAQVRKLADQDREQGLDLAGTAQMRQRFNRAVENELRRIDKSLGDSG